MKNHVQSIINGPQVILYKLGFILLMVKVDIKGSILTRGEWIGQPDGPDQSKPNQLNWFILVPIIESIEYDSIKIDQ